MFSFSLHQLSFVYLWWMLYLMILGWNIRDGTPLWRDLHCVDRSVVSFINTHTSLMIFILIAVLTCVRDVYVVKVISLFSALIWIDICCYICSAFDNLYIHLQQILQIFLNLKLRLFNFSCNSYYQGASLILVFLYLYMLTHYMYFTYILKGLCDL